MKKVTIFTIVMTCLILLLNGCSSSGSVEKNEGNSQVSNALNTEFNEVETDYAFGTPIGVGNGLAFLAVDNDSMFVIHNGEEIGKEYVEIDLLTDIGGKLAFIAFDGTEEFVVFNGKEIRNGYEFVDTLIEVNGKPAFIGVRGEKDYVNFNGQEFAEGYDLVDADYFMEINNKLAFIAVTGEKEVVVYDGKIISEEYLLVSYLGDANGKVIFIGVKDDVPRIVVGN